MSSPALLAKPTDLDLVNSWDDCNTETHPTLSCSMHRCKAQWRLGLTEFLKILGYFEEQGQRLWPHAAPSISSLTTEGSFSNAGDDEAEVIGL